MTSQSPSDEPRLIIVGDYLFDPRDGLLSGPTGVHHVCPRMAALLISLAEHPRCVVSREQLTSELWPDEPDASASLTQFVGRLRQYFGDTARAGNYIETVPRRGYRLVAPVFGSTREAKLLRPIQPNPAHRANRLFCLVQEFRERKVCRALLVYSIVIWLVFQITEIVVPALNLPAWVCSFVVVLGILGFPIAATLAWIFDLTPTGLVREGGTAANGQPGPGRNRTDFVFDTMLAAAALALCVTLVLSSVDSASSPLSQAEANDSIRSYAGPAGQLADSESCHLDLLSDVH